MEPFHSQNAQRWCSGSSTTIPESPQVESSRKYAKWKDDERRTFIAARETAIAEGHSHGKCFTKQGWERVATSFNSISGHNWSKVHLRNHWDAMRREHKRLSKLLACTGVEYNPSEGQIIASKEWWSRKLKEKEYKEFKDKDVSEIYARYRQLFGDSYDGDKYAVTPTKLCRTCFGLYEDSAFDDHRDAIPCDGESTGSSDEGADENRVESMHVTNARSGDNRKSTSSCRKGKNKKNSARELSYSVDRANSAAEEVAAKINTIMAPSKHVGVVAVEELLAAGRLERCTPLYYYACTLLAQKHYRDMLAVMQTTYEKYGWIVWQYNESNKPGL